MSNKRVLFVDDDVQLAEVLARQARSLGLEAFTAHNPLTALKLIDDQTPDVVCLDVNMPTGDGLCLGEVVASSARQTPIVVLTGQSDDLTRRRAEKLGAQFLVKGSDTWRRLRRTLASMLELDLPDEPANSGRESAESITEVVFEMLGASDSFLDFMSDPTGHSDADQGKAAEPWVLCIEDDQDFSLALQLRLKKHGISVVRAFEGMSGVKAALHQPAEAILLDYNLPNGRGDYVLRRLKANPVTRDIPVIVVSGQKRAGLEKEMLLLGAARFFSKPVRFSELIEELKNHVPVAL